MKPSLLLRIAATIALVQFVAHTALLLSYVPTHGPTETAVVDAMKLNRFDFGGFAPHSYWEMYVGYGLFAAVNCLIEAVLFWQLVRLVQTDPARTRPIIALFVVANIAYAMLVWRYFFVIPLIFDVAIAAFLGSALIGIRSAKPLSPVRVNRQA